MKHHTKTQIFLLHFAGGSCYSFDFLKKHIDSRFEFIPVELPGRGKRFHEPLINHKEEAIQNYFQQLVKLRNGGAYMIYGHSMGADLGFYLTKKMEKKGDRPNYLVVSGNPGPGVEELDKDGRAVDRKRYLLNDQEFKEELRKMGGIPNEVLEDKELYDFFNPIIRADFEILEKSNNLNVQFKLQTPIYAIMGSNEDSMADIKNWKNYTQSIFQSKILKGNHFFIHDHPKELAEIFMNCSQGLVAR